MLKNDKKENNIEEWLSNKTNLLILTSIWLIFMFVLYLNWDELFAPFVEIVGSIVAMCWIGLGCLLIVGWVLIRNKEKILSAIMVGLITINGFFFYTEGYWIATLIKFYLNKSCYEQVINQQLEVTKIQQLCSCGSSQEYPIQSDSIRIGFPFSMGILGKWQGFVYDPTDFVFKNNYFEMKSSYPQDKSIKPVYLFGDKLIAAKHITGHWYICYFA